MLSLETSLAFFGVALLVALAPGPDNLFVLMLSTARGRMAGMWAIFGLCTGLLVHTLAVALGLAALFAASATAFTVLKYVGAAYLAYLAWQAYRAPIEPIAAGPQVAIPALRLYVRGIFMNLTNPKVVLFFLAFLPQFVDARGDSVALQLGMLGALFIVATLVAFGAIACTADLVGARLRRSPRAQRVMNRISACVFAGLALRLAAAHR